MELTADCTRYDGWWVVTVPGVRGLHTQVRRLDQVEAMVKDAASLLLDRPESDFTITVRIDAEPFTSEDDAMDFATRTSLRMLNETR